MNLKRLTILFSGRNFGFLTTSKRVRLFVPFPFTFLFKFPFAGKIFAAGKLTEFAVSVAGQVGTNKQCYTIITTFRFLDTKLVITKQTHLFTKESLFTLSKTHLFNKEFKKQ